MSNWHKTPSIIPHKGQQRRVKSWELREVDNSRFVRIIATLDNGSELGFGVLDAKFDAEGNIEYCLPSGEPLKF